MPGGTTYSLACRAPSIVVGKHRSSSSHTLSLDAAVSVGKRRAGSWVWFECWLGVAAPGWDPCRRTGNWVWLRLDAGVGVGQVRGIGFGFEFWLGVAADSGR